MSSPMYFQSRVHIAVIFNLGLACKREPGCSVVDMIQFDSRGAVRIERTRRFQIAQLLTASDQEPESVFYDRAAKGAVEILNLGYLGLAH